MTQRTINTFRLFLFNREVSKEVVDTVEYPMTWWDAFKQRWCPKFLKKRFPVKKIKCDVVVHHNHMCPHLNIQAQGSHLSFLSMTTPYVSPALKPKENIIEQLADLLRDCRIKGHTEKEFHIHPEYYAILRQEAHTYMFETEGNPTQVLGVPIIEDINVQDFVLIET